MSSSGNIFGLGPSHCGSIPHIVTFYRVDVAQLAERMIVAHKAIGANPVIYILVYSLTTGHSALN